MSSRSKGMRAASAKDSKDPFSSPTHLAYSSFSHIDELPDLYMAVGLRNEKDDVQEVIDRILPMSRIVPGKKAEKRTVSNIGTIEDCEVPECLARQDRYRELGNANNSVKTQYEELEMHIKLTVNKLHMMEKTNTAVEGSNDKLQEQLDELRSHSRILEAESQQWILQNTELKKRLNLLEAEISKLRAQADERRSVKEQAEKSASVEVVFAPRRSPIKLSRESRDVADLDDWGDDRSDTSSTDGRRGGGKQGAFTLMTPKTRF